MGKDKSGTLLTLPVGDVSLCQESVNRLVGENIDLLKENKKLGDALYSVKVEKESHEVRRANLDLIVQNTELSAGIRDLTSRNVGQAFSIAALAQSVGDLKGTVASLSNIREGLRGDVACLRDQAFEYEQERLELKALMEKILPRYHDILDAMKSLRADALETQGQAHDLQAAASRLQDASAELEELSQALLEENDRLRTENTGLRQQATQWAAGSIALKQEVRELNAVNSLGSAHVTELKQEIATLTFVLRVIRRRHPAAYKAAKAETLKFCEDRERLSAEEWLASLATGPTVPEGEKLCECGQAVCDICGKGCVACACDIEEG